MANIVGTVRVTCKKILESSSSYAKNGMSAFNGRSASIFRISTDYSINPWFYIFKLVEFKIWILITNKLRFFRTQGFVLWVLLLCTYLN